MNYYTTSQTIFELPIFKFMLTHSLLQSMRSNVLPHMLYLPKSTLRASNLWYLNSYQVETRTLNIRNITPEGRKFLHAIKRQNCKYLSIGEPTYWPSDPNKLPHLSDFFILHGITSDYM
jgi:hypothetical protein